jgi:hypothetical protein
VNVEDEVCGAVVQVDHSRECCSRAVRDESTSGSVVVAWEEDYGAISGILEIS